MFDDKGAAVVDPFQNDGFAFEIGKAVGLAGGVGEGEVRGGLSDFRGGVQECEREEGGEQECGKIFHIFVGWF